MSPERAVLLHSDRGKYNYRQPHFAFCGGAPLARNCCIPVTAIKMQKWLIMTQARREFLQCHRDAGEPTATATLAPSKGLPAASSSRATWTADHLAASSKVSRSRTHGVVIEIALTQPLERSRNKWPQSSVPCDKLILKVRMRG
jgi:hypothetical protein